MAEDPLNSVDRPAFVPIVNPVRCPTCEEVVDPATALRAGRTTYLLCWNGHRFGLDGSVVAGLGSSASTSIALTECASSEACAG